MDLRHLKTLIEGSKLLTKEQSAYWLSKLEVMTQEQLARLEGILTRAASIDWTVAVTRAEEAARTVQTIVTQTSHALA